MAVADVKSTSDGPGSGGQLRKKGRTAVACKACRTLKTRCDGARPSCSQCEESSKECDYHNVQETANILLHKRYIQKLDRRLDSLENQIGLLTSQQRRSVTCDSVDRRSGSSTSLYDGVVVVQRSTELRGEHSSDAATLSHREAEEGGDFFGPSSTIAFTQNVDRALRSGGFNESPALFPDAISTLTGRNSLAPSHIDLRDWGGGSPPSFDRAASPYILPPPDQVRAMLGAYFTNTGALFPIVHGPSFLKSYEERVVQRDGKISRAWLALLNIMLAIVQIRGDVSNSPVGDRNAQADLSCWRAAKLCSPTLTPQVKLEDVQCLVLMSIFYEHRQKTSELWAVHERAVRAASKLGLGGQVRFDCATPTEAEMRKRTWFCCVLLDGQFSTALGRPRIIPDSQASEPGCAPIDNDGTPDFSLELTPDLGLKSFIAYIHLTFMTNKITDKIYGRNINSAISLSWSDLVQEIVALDQELARLEQSLNKSFGSLSESSILPSNDSQSYADRRCRLLITLRKLKVQILVHRPCLAKILRETERDHNSILVSPFVDDVVAASIKSCVTAAKQIITIASVSVDAGNSGPLMLKPWWLCLDYIFGAALIIFGDFVLEKTRSFAPHQSFLAFEDCESLLMRASTTIRKLDGDNQELGKFASVLESLRAFASWHGQKERTFLVPSNINLMGGDTQNPPIAAPILNKNTTTSDYSHSMTLQPLQSCAFPVSASELGDGDLDMVPLPELQQPQQGPSFPDFMPLVHRQQWYGDLIWTQFMAQNDLSEPWHW